MTRSSKISLLLATVLVSVTAVAALADGWTAYAISGVVTFAILVVGTPLTLIDAPARGAARKHDDPFLRDAT